MPLYGARVLFIFQTFKTDICFRRNHHCDLLICAWPGHGRCTNKRARARTIFILYFGIERIFLHHYNDLNERRNDMTARISSLVYLYISYFSRISYDGRRNILCHFAVLNKNNIPHLAKDQTINFVCACLCYSSS